MRPTKATLLVGIDDRISAFEGWETMKMNGLVLLFLGLLGCGRHEVTQAAAATPSTSADTAAAVDAAALSSLSFREETQSWVGTYESKCTVAAGVSFVDTLQLSIQGGRLVGEYDHDGQQTDLRARVLATPTGEGGSVLNVTLLEELPNNVGFKYFARSKAGDPVLSVARTSVGEIMQFGTSDCAEEVKGYYRTWREIPVDAGK